MAKLAFRSNLLPVEPGVPVLLVMLWRTLLEGVAVWALKTNGLAELKLAAAPKLKLASLTEVTTGFEAMTEVEVGLAALRFARGDFLVDFSSGFNDGNVEVDFPGVMIWLNRSFFFCKYWPNVSILSN